MILGNPPRFKRLTRPIVIIFILLLLSAGFVVERVRATGVIEEKLGIFVQVLDILKNDYVEKNLDFTKLLYGSIQGLLEALDDPYTRFVEPRAYKEMGLRQGGQYSGIGIYIGMKDKQLTVIAPIRGTPAGRAKLRPGDRIASIDDKSTDKMALDEAVTLIRGLKGTTVKLGIMRGKAKEPKFFQIARDTIVVKSVESTTYRSGTIGYIRLVTFENQNAAKEMEDALVELKDKNVEGLVLDVRNNGGGLLRNAVDIGGLFLGNLPIVHTVDRDAHRETLFAGTSKIWDKPIVVLMNEASASASEILAGALKDHKIAQLVGTHSFGKASVQNVRPLDDGSAILVTIAKYLTPEGHDIMKKGIMPDVNVEIPKREGHEEELYDEYGGIRIEKDTQLKRAIQILSEEIQSQS